MIATQRKAKQTVLFGASNGTGYQPLPSIWTGTDDELLERLLTFYPRTKPTLILDATVNGGRFWRGSKRPVIGLDIERRHRPMVVGDNTNMPFRDRCIDVVVYDPPHIPNQGRDRSKDFNTRFGLGGRAASEHGCSFSHMFAPFVQGKRSTAGMNPAARTRFPAAFPALRG